MRVKLFVTTSLAVFLLQACSGQATRFETDSLENGKQSSIQTLDKADKSGNTSKNTLEIMPVKNDQLTTPETQIIRELYHAGCLIEDFELDRRKQNMRISCAKDIVPVKSRI